MQKITSSQNQHVKLVIRLRESRQRRKQKRFVVDGQKEILRACSAAVQFEQVFVCRDQMTAESFDQLRTGIEANGANDNKSPDLFDLTAEVFAKIAFGSRMNEPVAVAHQMKTTLSDIPYDPGSLIAVIESIEKPGNVGAVIRSACGAGCGGVIIADPATDLFNPNTIRASLGSIFSIPVCACSSSEAITWLAEHRFQIVTARVDADRSYLDVDYRQSTAFVLGSEAHGLSNQWREIGMTAVNIPMVGDVDSLNISVSAAILFYESLRQRTRDQ